MGWFWFREVCWFLIDIDGTIFMFKELKVLWGGKGEEVEEILNKLYINNIKLVMILKGSEKSLVVMRVLFKF